MSVLVENLSSSLFCLSAATLNASRSTPDTPTCHNSPSICPSVCFLFSFSLSFSLFFTCGSRLITPTTFSAYQDIFSFKFPIILGHFIKAEQGLTCHTADQNQTLSFKSLTEKKEEKELQSVSRTHIRWTVMLAISLKTQLHR